MGVNTMPNHNGESCNSKAGKVQVCSCLGHVRGFSQTVRLGTKLQVKQARIQGKEGCKGTYTAKGKVGRLETKEGMGVCLGPRLGKGWEWHGHNGV